MIIIRIVILSLKGVSQRFAVLTVLNIRAENQSKNQ